MKTKDFLISSSSENYKPLFLLSWGKFLTYDEMKKCDMRDVYDLYVINHKCDKPEDWKKYIIAYNENNIKKALCININTLFNDFLYHNGCMANIYMDDINNWLYILDDNSRYNKKRHCNKDLILFLKEICKKYDFDINFDYILKEMDKNKKHVDNNGH